MTEPTMQLLSNDPVLVLVITDKGPQLAATGQGFTHNRLLEELCKNGKLEALQCIWKYEPNYITHNPNTNALYLIDTAYKHGQMHVVSWYWNLNVLDDWQKIVHIQRVFNYCKDTLAWWLIATMSAADWWKFHDTIVNYTWCDRPMKHVIAEWVRTISPLRVRFMTTIAPELMRCCPVKN